MSESETTLGRPRQLDSARRQRHLLQLLIAGEPWDVAAREAKVKPETVLRLLNRADFAAVAKTVLEEQLIVAVEVAPTTSAIAA